MHGKLHLYSQTDPDKLLRIASVKPHVTSVDGLMEMFRDSAHVLEERSVFMATPIAVECEGDSFDEEEDEQQHQGEWEIDSARDVAKAINQDPVGWFRNPTCGKIIGPNSVALYIMPSQPAPGLQQQQPPPQQLQPTGTASSGHVSTGQQTFISKKVGWLSLQWEIVSTLLAPLVGHAETVLQAVRPHTKTRHSSI